MIKIHLGMTLLQLAHFNNICNVCMGNNVQKKYIYMYMINIIDCIQYIVCMGMIF